MDPVEVREEPDPRRVVPVRDGVGSIYDVGEYERALDEALRRAGWPELRAEQAARRARADRVALGIGVATTWRSRRSRKEFGPVEVHGDGGVTVVTGTSPHGQGHETAFAQPSGPYSACRWRPSASSIPTPVS